MRKTLRLILVILLVLSQAAAKTPSRKPVRARHGMVVSAEKLASKVGRDILKQGGNAVDAAVATGFALAVTFPQAGNIGGGGYMVIRMADGTTTTFDCREKAPGKAFRDMYLDSAGRFISARSEQGYLSIGVPGSVAGLLDALAKYGTMKREQILAPAINLAERGFPVGASLAKVMNEKIDELNCYVGTKRAFTRKGKPYRKGDTLVQKDLAQTLRRISSQGKDGFYKGRTARLIVQEMKRGGGLITLDDLGNYRALERPAVHGTYRGYDIVSVGPSSSGGIVLIELLNILERYDIASSGFGTPRTISLMAEAMKLAYADRAEFLGDEDFYAVPVRTLLSKNYADERARLIDTAKAPPASVIAHGVIPPNEGAHTTHYSVVDRWGNAVSTTTTINSWFGSGVVVSGAGFLLNNEMDDFSAKPGAPNQFGLIGGTANAIQANKRMLSAMTPTIVLKDSQPVLVVGSPGGSTIITTVLQAVLNIIDYKMNVRDAVDAMRVHHQWYPDTLYYENNSLSKVVIRQLRMRGYNLAERAGHQGEVEAIVVDRKHKLLYGAADPRGHGAVAGY
jgi:gamma-glutamyltranspeptidase/glutathione hydrolase